MDNRFQRRKLSPQTNQLKAKKMEFIFEIMAWLIVMTFITYFIGDGLTARRSDLRRPMATKNGRKS